MSILAQRHFKQKDMLENLLAEQVRARRMVFLVSDLPTESPLTQNGAEPASGICLLDFGGVPEGLNSDFREHGASPISRDIAQVGDALQPKFAQCRRRAPIPSGRTRGAESI